MSAVTVAIISSGPLGHSALTSDGALNIIVLSIWTFAWFTDRTLALQFSVCLGFILDFLSFMPFGYWLLLLLLLALTIDYVKQRFLEVSVLYQSLLVLVGASLVYELANVLVARGALNSSAIYSIVYTVIAGVAVYYVAAIRFRLRQRWLGKRI